MYAVSLYCYDASIYTGRRGQIEIFVQETSRSLALYFRHRFCYLGANYYSLFYDCSSFGNLGEVFGHGGEFSLALV